MRWLVTMACNKPSHQDLHSLPFCAWSLSNTPFATMDQVRFKDGRVHFKNLRVKGLTSQQACNIETMSIQPWFNVLMLNQHYINVVSTLCSCWTERLCNYGKLCMSGSENKVHADSKGTGQPAYLMSNQYPLMVSLAILDYICSRLLLSRIPRDFLKYFEICIPPHIRFAELRKK